MRDLVYQIKNNNFQQWKAHIGEGVVTVIHPMLQNTSREVEYPPDICRATRGACI